MMMPVNVHEIIPTAVERTLDSLVGGVVLCGVAWTWLRVAYRQNSASRFFILFILLVGIAVLPFLFLAPGTNAVSAENRSLITLPEHFAEYLFVGWATIASVLLARVAVGFIQLRQLKRRCVAIDFASLNSRIQSALRNSPRPVELCVSARVSVPTALGFGSSAKIAIPDWLISQLSPEELHHLVLHELAHLRRWDDWTNLAQRVLGALLFFHPAIWWLQSQLSLEREMACDECVLAETGNARAYAKSLATIAERSFAHRSLVQRTIALAQAAVSRLHDTTMRVAKILSPAPRKPYSTIMMVTSAVAFGGLSAAIALFSPNVVGFSETPATVISSTATAPAMKPVMASLKLSDVTPKMTLASAKSSHLQIGHSQNQVARPALARVGQKPSLVVAVKATRDQYISAQPAMLVVWQETYRDDGSVIIQQSFYRVVVLKNITPKEQPAKTT